MAKDLKYRDLKYKPEYCEAVIEHMAQGDPLETFGATIDVSKMTLYNWIKKHPEFAESVEIGKVHCYKWWFTLGKGMATGKLKGNPTPWVFTMKNIFGWLDAIESKTNVDIKGIVFTKEKPAKD